MDCKICNTVTSEFDTKTVLGKYKARYYQCPHCGFIQTEEPFWLDEAYNNAITHLDLGLVYRNEYLAPIVSCVINLFFKKEKQFIDYGGGYGLFVRMMRDRGFDFYRQDLFCENIFSRHFDITDLPPGIKFELLTAFEVFEHLRDPLEEIGKMLEYSDNILFTTELQPAGEQALQSWWYFSPETGQHISFYTKRSLQFIAEKFNLHFLSHNNLHLFSKDRKSQLLYKLAFRKIIQRVIGKMNKQDSLLIKDYNMIKHMKE